MLANILVEVGTNIRAIRIAQGQTVEEFALENGWMKQQVSRWEQGRTDMRLSSLGRIAQALQVKVSDLTTGLEGRKGGRKG